MGFVWDEGKAIKRPKSCVFFFQGRDHRKKPISTMAMYNKLASVSLVKRPEFFSVSPSFPAFLSFVSKIYFTEACH